MPSALFQFLQAYRCKPGQKWNGQRTHYSIASPPASYAVPPDQMAHFRTHYREAIFKHGDLCHLVEANQDYTPIKIDLDFHYELEKGEEVQPRRYTKTNIQQFIQLYMDVIESIVIDPREHERLCLIMEKPTPIRNPKAGEKAWKDGVHIIFPKLICHHTLQSLFRVKVLERISECFPNDVFTNSWGDILDSHIIRSSGWQMLGSRKPGKDAYMVSQAYYVYKDQCDDQDVARMDSSELVDLTTMIGFKSSDCIPVKITMKEHVAELIKNSDPKDFYKKKIRPGVLRTFGTRLSCANNETLELTRKLVELLNPSRAESYNSWIELGWCLHNIHNKSHELLDVWIEFSKQSPRHAREAEQACREAWIRMADDGLGIGSLRMWARDDNNEGYRDLIKDELFPKILSMCRNDGKIQAGDVSDLMAIMFKDQIVCVNEKPEVWYRFSKDHHRWMKTEQVILRSKITQDVYQEFKTVHRVYLDRSQDSESEEHKQATNIFKGMQKLRTPIFKSQVIRELMEPFYDVGRKFYDTLNERKHLLGMENGTYDLHAGEFRDGRPDDRITYSTGCNYPDMSDPGTADFIHKKIGEIQQFLNQILPNARVRKFVLNVLASFLSGHTNEEHFHIWTGSGGNGKSKLIELFEYAIGNYGCKLPVSLITGKRTASSAASPEIAMLKGKRFASMQEPSADSKINAGLMKELTGGDKLYARALFAEPIEFKPQAKIIMSCNDPPELPKDDGGVWRRVKMANFPAKFKEEDELTTQDGHWNSDKTVWTPKDPLNPVYPMDGQIDQKFEDWKEAFLYMLLEQYKVYQKEGLHIPPEVKASTDGYKKSQFKLSMFFNECVMVDTEYEVSISDAEIYNKYKDWYVETQGSNKKDMLTKDKMVQYLQSYYGDHLIEGSKHMYTHIRFNTDPATGGHVGGAIDMASRSSEHVGFH